MAQKPTRKTIPEAWIAGQKKAMTPAAMSAAPSRNNGQERSYLLRASVTEPQLAGQLPSRLGLNRPCNPLGSTTIEILAR
jgi:hypothetical protein